MIWQDIVLSVTAFLFGYALIPQIYNNFKKKKRTIVVQTALITTVGLIANSIALFALNLLSTAIITLIMALLWGTLLVQSVVYKNKI